MGNLAAININDMMYINETTGYIVGNAMQTNGTVRKNLIQKYIDRHIHGVTLGNGGISTSH